MAGKIMAYQIEYAYASHIGKIRANNQDNFWCCGDFLEEDNKGTDGVRCGRASLLEAPFLAVFDGMGGESCGEAAAYIAAAECQKYFQDNRKKGQAMDEFLRECCENMNAAVCFYAEENRIRSMGTTAALVGFDRNWIWGCNLGDSRIYEEFQGKMKLLSTDHVLQTVTFGKPPLTQYIGIPEESMALEPSIACTDWNPGKRFLLCSDGLTDMLAEEEINQILSRGMALDETVGLLIEKSLENGGRDNITVVLCEIQEENIRSFIKRWLKARKKQG